MIQSFAVLAMKAQPVFRKPRKVGSMPFFQEFFCFTQRQIHGENVEQ